MRPLTKENAMKKFVNNLKQTAIAHPVQTVLVAAVAITATAKLIEACGGAVGSAAYAKQVAMRAARS